MFVTIKRFLIRFQQRQSLYNYFVALKRAVIWLSFFTRRENVLNENHTAAKNLLLLWCSLDFDDLVLATVLGESSFGNTAFEGGVDEAPGGFLGTEGFLDGLEG